MAKKYKGFEIDLDGLTLGQMRRILMSQSEDWGRLLNGRMKEWPFESDPNDPTTWGDLYAEDFHKLAQAILKIIEKRLDENIGLYSFELSKIPMREYEALAELNITSPSFYADLSKIAKRTLNLNWEVDEDFDWEELDFFGKYGPWIRSFRNAIKDHSKRLGE
jgi:hypothetical protein